MKVPISLKVIMAATLTMCVVAFISFYKQGDYPRAIITSVVFVFNAIICGFVLFGKQIGGVSKGEFLLWFKLNSEKIVAILVLTAIALVGLCIIFKHLKSYNLW